MRKQEILRWRLGDGVSSEVQPRLLSCHDRRNAHQPDLRDVPVLSVQLDLMLPHEILQQVAAGTRAAHSRRPH